MSDHRRQQALFSLDDDRQQEGNEPLPSAQPEAAPPDPNDRPKVYVVDAFSLIFQVFHALPEMTSPSGQPVAAIHGFARDLIDLLEKKKPDFFFCAFDASEATFRDELFPQYKAGRAEMPADLKLQIPHIRRIVEALGIPALELAGYEADDVLATVARRADALGFDCYLVTSDKDCRQLITERVKMYNIRKDQVFDAAALEADWGIRPDQVVDFQALVGDSVDNVPGVALIGPKIAAELLRKYETLEGVLDHAWEVSGDKRRENLLQGREIALLSRRLVRLVDDLPLDFDWDAGRPGRFNPAMMEELCQEFGFRRLADRARRLAGRAAGDELSATAAANSLLTGERRSPAFPKSRASGERTSSNPPITITDRSPSPITDHRSPITVHRSQTPDDRLQTADYRTVATPQELEQLVRDLSQQQRISVDTETTSTNPRWAEIVGYSFAWNPGLAYYIPVRAPAGEPQLDPDLVRDSLRPVLENPDIEKIGQNLKYDIVVLRSAGIRVRGVGLRHDGGGLPARPRRTQSQPGRSGQALSGPHDDQDP